MHPLMTQQAAAQHVNDMLAQAAAARRARQARRARRGLVVAATPVPLLEPCPELPCPPPVVREPATVKAA
jgi:hypothetical protein